MRAWNRLRNDDIDDEHGHVGDGMLSFAVSRSLEWSLNLHIKHSCDQRGTKCNFPRDLIRMVRFAVS